MSNDNNTFHAMANAGPAPDFNTFMRRQAAGLGNDPTLSPTASTAENIGDMIKRAQLTPAEEAARAGRIAAGERAREASLRNQQGPVSLGGAE